MYSIGAPLREKPLLSVLASEPLFQPNRPVGKVNWLFEPCARPWMKFPPASRMATASEDPAKDSALPEWVKY